MSFYNEQLQRAIMRQMMPRWKEKLDLADTHCISHRTSSILMPLVAEAACAQADGFGEYIVSASVRPTDANQEWLSSHCVFSSAVLEQAHDQAAVIEHICDNLKRNMLVGLAKKQAEKMAREVSAQ